MSEEIINWEHMYKTRLEAYDSLHDDYEKIHKDYHKIINENRHLDKYKCIICDYTGEEYTEYQCKHCQLAFQTPKEQSEFSLIKALDYARLQHNEKRKDHQAEWAEVIDHE